MTMSGRNAAGDTAWLLGTSWNSAANDDACSKFLNDVQEFVSISKTDISAVPKLLGISPAMADLHRKATQSLLHLAVLGDRCGNFHLCMRRDLHSIHSLASSVPAPSSLSPQSMLSSEAALQHATLCA